MRSVYNQIGPYEIHQEIGRGGMAVVFLATDTATGQRVALRTVPGYTAPDVLAAEHRGAELQEKFSRVSGFGPQLFKYGTESTTSTWRWSISTARTCRRPFAAGR